MAGSSDGADVAGLEEAEGALADVGELVGDDQGRLISAIVSRASSLKIS